jgi:hypothetical protein
MKKMGFTGRWFQLGKCARWCFHFGFATLPPPVT